MFCARTDTNQEILEKHSLRQPTRISLESFEKAKKSNKGSASSERSSKLSSSDTHFPNDSDHRRLHQADIHKQSTSFIASTPEHDSKALALPLNSVSLSNSFTTPHCSNQPTAINFSDAHRHLTDSSNSHASSSPLNDASLHPASTEALPASLSASNTLSLGMAAAKKPVSVTIDVNKANKLYKTEFLPEKSTSSDTSSQSDYHETKSMKSNQTEQFSDSPPSDYSEMSLKPTIARTKSRSIDIQKQSDQSQPCSQKPVETARPYSADAAYDAQDTHLQHAALNLSSSKDQQPESGSSQQASESHHNSMLKHSKGDISSDNTYKMQGIYLGAIFFFFFTNFLRI